jgi:hypothetical protein
MSTQQIEDVLNFFGDTDINNEKIQNTKAKIREEEKSSNTLTNISCNRNNLFKLTLFITGTYAIFSTPLVDSFLCMIFTTCNNYLIRFIVKLVFFLIIVYVIAKTLL